MHNVPTKHAPGLSRSTTVTRQMQKLSVICTAIEQVAIEFIFRGGLPPDKCIILYSLQDFDPESTQKPGERRKMMDGKGEYENSAKWQEQTKIEGAQFSRAPRIPAHHQLNTATRMRKAALVLALIHTWIWYWHPCRSSYYPGQSGYDIRFRRSLLPGLRARILTLEVVLWGLGCGSIE